MKRSLCLFIFVVFLSVLSATPNYMGVARSTNALPLSIQAMDLHDGHIYVADKKNNQVLGLSFADDDPFKPVFDFPQNTRPTDLFAGESSIYLLDSKNRNILVYNKAKGVLNTINFDGVKEINIAKAHRIIANYQDFIYLLTDKEIICLSAEGMLMNKRPIEKGITMTLGKDELIRVLSEDGKALRMSVLNQYLYLEDDFHIRKVGNQVPAFIDCAVNHWGEYHVINNKPISIAKIDNKGGVVMGSGFGSYQSKLMQGYFANPKRIRCMEYEGNSLLAIYDAKHLSIQLFSDNEPDSRQKLLRPAYTVRPSLKNGDLFSFNDAVYTEDAVYVISQKHVTKGHNVGEEGVFCVDHEGNLRFTILPKLSKVRELKSVSALAVHENKLYILDAKSHYVFVFNAKTGAFMKYFGGKGNKGGLFRNPNSIYVDLSGNIYVSDFGARNIKIFSPSEAFLNTIPMIISEQKPILLRGYEDNLYCLCSDWTVIKITLNKLEKQVYMRLNKPIKSFAVLGKDRLAFVDQKNQKLEIYQDNKLSETFFAKDAKSQFPHFSDLQCLSYDPYQRRIAISDAKADMVRYLHFYSAMGERSEMKMTLTEDMKVKLSWKAGVGVKNWRLYIDDDEEGILLNTPEYLVSEAPKQIVSYSVAPVAEDGRIGKKDENLKDNYSYGQALLESGDYHQAAAQFMASKKNIADIRIDGIIATCFIRQADRHKKMGEYNEMRAELRKANDLCGMTLELALRFTENYRLMNSYAEGISFLDKLNDVKYMDNAELLKEYIELSYLTQNYAVVSQKASYYLTTFGHNREIKRYLADSYEKQGRYVDALSEYEELVQETPTFDDELKVGEINIILNQFTVAQVKLQSMSARYPRDKQDEINAMMGDGFYKNNQFGMAAEKYLAATRIDAGNASYFYMLGRSYSANMNLSEAQKAYQKACDLAPDNLSYALEFAKLLQREDLLYEAVAVLVKAEPHVKKGALTRDFHYFFSDLYFNMNEIEKAYEQIQKAMQFSAEGDEEVTRLSKVIRERLSILFMEKDPLEIVKVDFQPIFPSLSEYYRSNPIGQLILRNNRSDPISTAKIEVYARQVGKKIETFEVSNILPGTDKKVDVRMEFNESLFSGEKDVQVEIKLIYEFHGVDESKSMIPQTLHVHDSKRMNWELRQSYASFVNPKDELLENFVKQNIIQTFKEEPASEFGSNINRAVQVYNFYRANGITYAGDASVYNLDDSLLDDVQFPHHILVSKAGDCEDLLILLAASLENIGVRTAFVDLTNHVMLAVHSGLEDSQITASGLDAASFIKHNNENWFPLETTYLGKADFVRAWQKGIDQFKESVDRESIPDIIEFTEAHKIFPPANFKRAINSKNYSNKLDAIAFYREDLTNIKNMSLHNIECNFIETLEKFPTNLKVRLRYAQFLFKDKKQSADALVELETILRTEPYNFSALLTSAVVNTSIGNIERARELYLQSIPYAGKDIDQVYRSLCLLEYRNNNKSQALTHFKKMADKQLIRKDEPSIYADLSTMEE